MKTNVFDLRRIGLLFQRYFIERSRSELIYWGIMAIVMMFFRNNIPAMFGLISVAGIFYAARYFKEIHHSGNGVAYFMIPATQLEKLTVAIVITSFYYLTMMIIAYIVGNLAGTFLNNIFASIDFFPTALFHHSSLQWVLFKEVMPKFPDGMGVENMLWAMWFFITFLVYQSVYLFGGIYFRKNSAFKTFLVLILFFVLLAFLISIEIKLILDVTNLTETDIEGFSKSIFVDAAKIFYCLLPPFFWVVSYFRLTEKQV
jgi:hypothetical protein